MNEELANYIELAKSILAGYIEVLKLTNAPEIVSKIKEKQTDQSNLLNTLTLLSILGTNPKKRVSVISELIDQQLKQKEDEENDRTSTS